MANNGGQDGDSYDITPRTKVKRYAQRGAYDKKTVHAILDEGFICHIGFNVDSQPFVIPMGYGRVDEKVYFHGSVSNRMLKALKAGTDMCFTVTLLDGLVLARSGFNHSANSRSVVALGKAEAITDLDEKRKALDAIVNHMVPGRADELAVVRPPTDAEVKATTVLGLTLNEVSAKVRAGPGHDDKKDMDLDIWAGVLSMQQCVPGTAISDPDNKPGMEAPLYIKNYRRPTESGLQGGVH